jgi:hypothetical protein
MPDGDKLSELQERAAKARQQATGVRDNAGASVRRSRSATERWADHELAAAGVRLRAEMLMEELAAARERIKHLETALQTNRTIAMAIGIVMARRSLSADGAFERLRIASQQQHRKLRDLAEEIVYTGELPT